MIEQHWKVTIDHVWEPGDSWPSRVGTSGPRNGNNELPTPVKWRTFDADAGPIYEGEASSDDAAELAYEFSKSDVGATELQVWTGEVWEVLF